VIFLSSFHGRAGCREISRAVDERREFARALLLTFLDVFLGAGGLGFSVRAGVNIFLLMFRIFRTPK
jgi:hypothetical protein